jgi:hypothetical protein
MKFLPAIELTGQARMLLAHGALRLQPGQWIIENGVRGRYLRTNRRTGVSYFSWERPEESWSQQAQRFHRACVKGFVGKYAPYYEVVKAMREAERRQRGAPSDDRQPNLPF